MGERFVLNRLEPKEEGQFDFALKHVGPKTKQMRSELAEAVARLFVGRRVEPRPIARPAWRRRSVTSSRTSTPRCSRSIAFSR
jgi:hypothetical protein